MKEKISIIEVKKEENITVSREKAPSCSSKVIKPILNAFPGVHLVGIYGGEAGLSNFHLFQIWLNKVVSLNACPRGATENKS